MSKLVVDDAVRDMLTANGPQAEIFDKAGNSCGYFFTEEGYVQLLYALAKAENTDAQAERARRDYELHGGVSLTEALEIAKKRLPPQNEAP